MIKIVIMVEAILKNLRSDLAAHADEQAAANSCRFFKEQVKPYGIKTALVSQIAKSHFKAIQPLDKRQIFDLCEELWASGYLEESFVACHWSYAVRDRYQPADFSIFESWVANYVSNWAACDTLCNHTIGAFIEQYPKFITNLKGWCSADQRWMRRAAAVSLIVPARKGLFLADILDIAGHLLEDSDDLVRKGYGWMLKAASQAHQPAVFKFVMAKKARMLRTALRYAIEKMPPNLKQLAMQK